MACEGDRGQVGGWRREEPTLAPTATPPAALCPHDPVGHALVADANTAASSTIFLFCPRIDWGEGRGAGEDASCVGIMNFR